MSALTVGNAGGRRLAPVLAGLVGVTVAFSTAMPVALGLGSTPVPVLGSKTAFPSGKGFGAVKPRVVFLGGDPTGYVSSISWRHWGDARAVGSGRGWCPGRSVAAGYHCKASLRVSGLGTCDGRSAYRDLTFYFKTRRGWMLGSKRNACTGG